MSGPLAAFAVTRRGATPHSDAKSRIRTLQVRSPGDPANPRTPAAEVGATVQSRPNSAHRGYAEQGSATHNLRGRPCPASPVDPKVRSANAAPPTATTAMSPLTTAAAPRRSCTRYRATATFVTRSGILEIARIT